MYIVIIICIYIYIYIYIHKYVSTFAKNRHAVVLFVLRFLYLRSPRAKLRALLRTQRQGRHRSGPRLRFDDLPIKKFGDFPVRYVGLPGGRVKPHERPGFFR